MPALRGSGGDEPAPRAQDAGSRSLDVGTGSQDRIELRALRVLGTHGLLPEERDRSQPFEVDVDAWLDVSAAARSDDLSDTIDYGALCAAAAAVVGGRDRLQLIESLAGTVADRLLDLDGRLTKVAVTVRKLRPPVPLDLGSAGVRVVRCRARGR